MRAPAAVTLALVALGGCTLLVDMSGLSDGQTPAPDASSTDDAPAASADASDAGADAHDARPQDVGAGDEVPQPACDALAPLGEAGCACAVHDFCDDFDHGPLGAMWSQVIPVGGTLTLDPLAVSPPSSLLVAYTDGGSEELLLEKYFATAKGIRCQLDLRVDAFDNYTDVLHFEFIEPTDSYFIRVSLGGGGDLNEYGQFADGGERVRNNWPFTQPAPGAWVNMVIDVRANGGTGTATLIIDQVQTLNVALEPPTDTTSIRLELGAISTVPAAWRARYDNVACDLPR